MLGACVTINADAVRHNVSVIKACADEKTFIWMVKCNAYGHGVEAIVPLLPESDSLGVASLDELNRLLDLGVQASRIVLMRGFLDANECDTLCRLGCQIVMHADDQWSVLNQSLKRGFIPSAVWLHVDTGMSRLGIAMDRFDESYAALRQSAKDLFPVHVMTHLACADQCGSSSVASQLEAFSRLTIHPGSQRCVLNSAGMAHYPSFESDCIRPGIALYGISPLSTPHPLMDTLRPVMTFTAPVIVVKTIPKGASVGYGGTWVAERDSQIAMCAVGYGDGYPREVTRAQVLCADALCPVVGRVSMDFIAVDVTDLSGPVNAGDRVELWGERLLANRLADSACTIPYTLFTGVSSRVHRTIGEDDDTN